ncbi:hypothetical protein N9L47_12220 [Rhodobacteraceae bacterium]|nr:hypothetical protein [Paracoccaceae bacterium]
MIDILLYRLFRLRRTLVLGIFPSLTTVLAIGLYSGETYSHLIALAVLIPVAHVVVYPNNWTETLAVSLILSVCLGLATFIPPHLDTGPLLIRAFGLSFLWIVLFFILIVSLGHLESAGPTSDKPVRTSAWSGLPPDVLRKTLTLYPGRKDDNVTCGEADAEGRFPVTIRQVFTPPTYSIDLTPEMEEIGMSQDGVIESHGHAVIHSTGPDHHEVFHFDAETDEVSVSRYSFHDLEEKGTRVVLEEAGIALSIGNHFGMWLSDFLTDYLTHGIDAAEARRPRANRAFAHRQLVVDIANVIIPCLAWMGAYD